MRSASGSKALASDTAHGQHATATRLPCSHRHAPHMSFRKNRCPHSPVPTTTQARAYRHHHKEASQYSNSHCNIHQLESGCPALARSHSITRREVLQQLGVAGGILLLPVAPTPAANLGEEAGPLVCSSQLENQLVDVFTQAIYDTLEKLKVMDLDAFRQEVEQLQQRELPYYQQATKQRPAATASTGAPELATEQLSPQQLFNFQYYIMWKVVAKHVVGPEARTSFNQAVGSSMLWQLWPDGIQQAKAAAELAGVVGRASEQQVVDLLRGLLDILVQGAYCCRYQIVWGELPGGWTQDWMTTQPVLDGVRPATDAPLPPGFSFQIKIHLPADIEGSVALRSEEDGFWSRAVSSMIFQLLALAGYAPLGSNVVTEFFFQDQWVGPKSVTDKILLGLGDPLEAVGIDFFPTTLVQDWELP